MALNEIFWRPIFLHFGQFNFYSSHVCVTRLVNWTAITDYIKVEWIYSGGSRGVTVGVIVPLKPTKVTLFTMILYDSENSTSDARSFGRLLFCENSVVKNALSLLHQPSEPVMRLDCQILLKSLP